MLIYTKYIFYVKVMLFKKSRFMVIQNFTKILQEP